MRWPDRAIHRHHRQIQITGSRMDKTFTKIPGVQRRNRLKTRVHRPKCGGRSRQGVPVRNRQRTPSRKRRLSTAVRPGSVTLPGHSGATRAHISSVKTVRSEFILSPTSSARAATFGVQSRHKDTISAQDARQLSTGLKIILRRSGGTCFSNCR